MKVIKPTAVGVVTRPYRLDGVERLGIVMPVMITLDEAPRIVGEQELWQVATESLGTAPLDAGFAKPHAEFLVAASAFETHCDGNRTSRVGIEFAGCTKHLGVAFPEAGDADRIALDDFMPVAADSPTRRPHYGEWNPASAAADPFGFPPAFNRAWFNVAPAEQQRRDLQAWPDSAPYRIAGMHPVQAQQQGTLPPIRSRCFVVRHSSPELEPVPMRLTTVWFMPDRERAVLVFHGETRIARFDATDIACLMFAVETPQERRGMEHYERVYKLRTEGQDATLHSLRDTDLMPSGMHAASAFSDPVQPAPAWQQAMKQHVERRAREARDRAQAQNPTHMSAASPAVNALPGFDQTEPASAMPRLNELAGYVAKLRVRAEKITADLKTHAEAVRAKAAAHPGAPAGIETARRGPPQIKRLMDATRNGPPLPIALQEVSDKLTALYRQSAQHREAALRADAEASKSVRNSLGDKLAQGVSLAGEDLTGIDLSGLDLRGADLRNALMESADLTDTNLENANLEGALLVRATLRRTQFAGANLRSANLSLADCDSASFRRATLDDATCEKTVFRHCDFSEAHLARTSLLECEWVAARFAKASLNHLVATGQTFSSADFSDTTIRKMTFVRCVLNDVSFSHADIEGFGMLETEATHTRFDNATIRKACFIKDTRLDAANFSGATLGEVNFRAASAPGIGLEGIRAVQCDFSDAILTGANLRGAKLADAVMTRTNLADADLSNSDLIGAMLRGATLARARLAAANLFRAMLAEAHLEDAEGLDEAYTVDTTWSPRAKATS